MARKTIFDKYLFRIRERDIDQTDVDISGGTISGVTISGSTMIENMTTATDPAENAAVTTEIIDAYNGVVVTLTGAGNNQTLQNPTTAENIKKFLVVNNDTSTNDLSVIANSVTFTLGAGESQMFAWDGTKWFPINIPITDVPVKVTEGGTGLSAMTDNVIYKGNGTSAMALSGITDDGTTITLGRASALGGDMNAGGYYLNNSQSIANLANGGANYWFNGSSNIAVATSTNLDGLSTHSFFVHFKISSKMTTLGRLFYMSGGGGYIACDINIDGTLTLISNTPGGSSGAIGGDWRDDKWHSLSMVRASTTSLLVHIDGVQKLSVATSSVNAPSGAVFYISGRSSDQYTLCSIDKFLVFNNNIALNETKDLSSGSSIPYKYEGASQTALTSGTLVVGKEYIIDTFVAGDDFTNVGGTNVTGNVFVATGTTPTTWTNSSSLRRQGCVLDLNSSGVGHNQWTDNSGNKLNGTVSGALPTAIPSDHVERYYKSAMTGDTTLTSVVPAGYCLEYIVFEETAGNTATLDLGTSAGGNQVFINQAVTASSITTVSINTVFSLSAATTLYLNDDDAGSSWNSGSVNATLVMRRVV